MLLYKVQFNTPKSTIPIFTIKREGIRCVKITKNIGIFTLSILVLSTTVDSV